MTGKQKCKILRQIRRDIAAANQLDYAERDCSHTGDCSGTCPYCEAQLKKLERELDTRRSRGQRIAVMGLSVGLIATNLTACDPLFGGRTLQGDMMADTGDTDTAQVALTDSIPGELIAQETTTELPVLEGEIPVEPLMGDPVLPEVTATMGILPVPEPEKEEGETTETFDETTSEELMGTYAVTELLVAGGLGPAPELPDPDEVREPETVAVEEPLKTP
ncbi:MAG: hypothetical protein IKD37_00885 [Clostridia bacterium]|nr:hypothetical protein [Butyricicoccus sp.]MBR7184140.1 hypothetical protein [Clostridia bacterium]